MSLIVVGHAERTMPVAAVASASAGERVLFTSHEDVGEIKVPVEGCGISGTAVLASIAPDAPLEGDCFVATGSTTALERLFTQRRDEFAGKPVLLAPGGFAGALMFAERFRQWGLAVPRFSEVPGWLAGGVLLDDQVQITIRKRSLDLAAASDADTAGALDLFGRFFPGLVGSDLVTTALANRNAMVHPPLAILNATRIENGEEFYYWDDGFSPAVERVMVAIDRERLALAEALHATGASLLESALDEYGSDGMRGDSFFEAVKSFPPYRRRQGPTELDGRFLVDDVPFGVAAYEQLAERVGVDHTALTAVRVLAEVILGRELRADAYAVEALAAYAHQRGVPAGPRSGGESK